MRYQFKERFPVAWINLIAKTSVAILAWKTAANMNPENGWFFIILMWLVANGIMVAAAAWPIIRDCFLRITKGWAFDAALRQANAGPQTGVLSMASDLDIGFYRDNTIKINPIVLKYADLEDLGHFLASVIHSRQSCKSINRYDFLQIWQELQSNSNANRTIKDTFEKLIAGAAGRHHHIGKDLEMELTGHLAARWEQKCLDKAYRDAQSIIEKARKAAKTN